MSAIMRTFGQLCLLAALVQILCFEVSSGSQLDGNLEDLFFGEDILPLSYQDNPWAELSRSRRQTNDGSPADFVSFVLILVGNLNAAQRTAGNQANTDLETELTSVLINYFQSEINGVTFVVEIDLTTDLTTTGNTPTLQVSGTITYTSSDFQTTFIDLARALDKLDQQDNLVIFSGQAGQLTLGVREPQQAAQSDPLKASKCYLCQSYEVCEKTGENWVCNFKDDRFYPFGIIQGDSTLDKNQGQTAARIIVQEKFPYIQTLYDTLYISLFGTISFGRRYFSSFAVQDLPVSGYNIVAPYWSHWRQSTLGEVYYQLYIKSSTNTPEETAVFQRANNDVSQYWFKDNFDASIVIVVTWVRILHYHATSDDERASFQAAIISDGSETYLTYIYGSNALKVKQRTGQRISVGWGTGTKSVLDTQTNYYRFDSVPGDTGKLGIWFFKIGEGENFEIKCRTWFNENVRQLPLIIFRQRRFAPRGCPCSRVLAQRNPMWINFPGTSCYDLFPFGIGRTWGRRCCYFGNILDNRLPFAGSYQSVSPLSGNYQGHLQQDAFPKEWCCQKSNLCGLYYIVRPRALCVRNFAINMFQWGDPHMLTTDGKSFTFNNLGEFTLINVNGQLPDTNTTVDLKAQARTCRATNVNGTETDATVWCGFALETTAKSRAQVTITKDQNETSQFMIIVANGRDYTVDFRNSTGAFEEPSQDVYLSRTDAGALHIATQDGISFSVSLASGILEFTVAIEPNLSNLTSGLMGIYNGDVSDDFTFPNGTQFDINARDREIYEFAKTWAITEATTVFTYDNGLGPADFANASFVPLFLDEVDNATITAAAQVCGDATDTACIFDFIATKNENLAKRTTVAKEGFDSETKEAEAVAPVVTGPDSVNVTLGQNVTLTFNVTISNSQNFTAALDEPSDQSELRESGSVVEIDYTPVSNVSDITSPTLVVVDQTNLTTLTQVEIIQCSGCSGKGSCDFNTRRQVISDYIAIAACDCLSPYAGNDCEIDKDGCAALPCPLLTNCTDVPAVEEERTGIAFTCTDCPAGFRNDTLGGCADIDECVENNPCPADSACQNNIGSYVCTCNSGYRKVAEENCQDVDECVELRNSCEQLCVNTPGDYRCECLSGYTLDVMGFNCTKDVVDPCANSNCSYHCNVNNGTSVCVCEQGFKLAADGTSCEDVNECDLNLCAQVCTNTIGSYSCSCLPGYTKDVDDEQECLVCAENKYGVNCASTCECKGRSSGCDSVRGCLCLPAWTGERCDVDVNECVQNVNSCLDNQQCVNTNGSFVCTCPVGYVINGDKCDDVNECEDVAVSQCPQDCVNNPGSFSCTCREGYTYNAKDNTCDDIDECATGLTGCEQKCTNAMGSYSCQCNVGFLINDDRKTCRKDTTNDPCAGFSKSCEFGCTVVNGTQQCFCQKGYRLDTDAQSCKDINECTNNALNLCSDTCTNTDGSYECSCPAGKKLDNDKRTCVVCDGFHWGDNCANVCNCNPLGTNKCDAVLGCQCKSGWNGTTCSEDVPECPNDPCPNNANCTETPGSFLCTCNTGFMLKEEPVGNKTCVDIDECDGNRVCDQDCVNSIGSYKCSCSSGFLLVGTDNCVDIDECANITNNQCDQTCRNLAGGFQCSCRTGYTLNTDNRKDCIDNDECADIRDHTCSNFEFCSNTPGSFDCACKAGYEQVNNTCIDSTIGNSSIITFSIRLDIPGADSAILNSSTQAFRAMEEKVSKQILIVGEAAVGTDLLSVVIVDFTSGSFIANTQLAVAAPDNTERKAVLGSTLTEALRTADMTSVAAGTSVLGVVVGSHSQINTSNPCESFKELYTCPGGSACSDTNGTPQCVDIPTEAPTTQEPTTQASTVPPDDDDNTDLIIGLAAGISAFLLLLLVIGIVVYMYTRRKTSDRQFDQSSIASGPPKSINSGLITRWRPDRRFPYSPDSFRTSGSSEDGGESTTSGPERDRPPRAMFPKDRPGADPFESPFMGPGGAAPATPRAPRADPTGRPPVQQPSSNFSWDNMFSLLEPHVPLEMPRPQVRPTQSPGGREGQGGHSSGEV